MNQWNTFLSLLQHYKKTVWKRRSKPLANRTIAAQQILNYTCTSFWNYAIFGIHGPAHRRRFIDINDTSVNPKSLHNLTSGEEYDHYFYAICHQLTTCASICFVVWIRISFFLFVLSVCAITLIAGMRNFPSFEIALGPMPPKWFQ